jgi:hypothetical protein
MKRTIGVVATAAAIAPTILLTATAQASPNCAPGTPPAACGSGGGGGGNGPVAQPPVQRVPPDR